MNKSIKYSRLFAVATVAALSFSACTKPFEEINTNPLKPQEHHLESDGLQSSAFMPSLQLTAYLPVATGGTGAANNYQVSFNLTADSWAGYMAPRDAKWPGRNLSQFYFDVGWTDGTFRNVTQSILSPWLQTKKVAFDIESPNKGLWGIAQITKIMGMHRATDMFGAIPYSQIGSGDFKVPYDSQEEIYKSFFTELETAVEDLYNIAKTGKTIYGLDYIYNGNPLKWAKLGNSLMLRLAMRVRYVAPEMSEEWATKALRHPAGLIETVADMAQISQKNGITTRNSLYITSESYNDVRMGASIACYMRGYSDPRMEVYFTGDDMNFAVPPAIPQTGDAYNKAAKPLVNEFDATVWFRPSETLFLLAEAALAGYPTESNAKTYYDRAITTSFEERGVEGAEAYINSSAKPASFKDLAGKGYDATAPSSVTVRWSDNTDPEVSLEKIITQKYIAIFPDGQEAWSEWRRTGYPRLLAPNTNISNAGVLRGDGHTEGVRCWPYPQQELNDNTENVNAAITAYKDGFNGANVRVWWDAKPGM